MKFFKTTLGAFAIVAIIFLIGFIIFMSTSTDKVPGDVAFKYAMTSGWYKVGVVFGFALIIALIIWIEKSGKVTGFEAFGVGVVFTLLTIFYPTSIKTDPIPSGITQSQIDSLHIVPLLPTKP